ncbi:MAG: hypothetical protein DME61_00680 [Verrucomicrobia bacterium]|nr:MAG: hypothetical protein DME61_00680 [Verrucomicrobiota bacterium]
MRRCLAFVLICSLAAAQQTLSSNTAEDEQTLWHLERAYWQYVENNDLSTYTNLWHEDFLGWPSISSVPVRKDHITDWITSQTSKGLTFKAGYLLLDNAQVGGQTRGRSGTYSAHHTCVGAERKGLADHRRDVHAGA